MKSGISALRSLSKMLKCARDVPSERDIKNKNPAIKTLINSATPKPWKRKRDWQ
jgi:hypothetical protein